MVFVDFFSMLVGFPGRASALRGCFFYIALIGLRASVDGDKREHAHRRHVDGDVDRIVG